PATSAGTLISRLAAPPLAKTAWPTAGRKAMRRPGLRRPVGTAGCVVGPDGARAASGRTPRASASAHPGGRSLGRPSPCSERLVLGTWDRTARGWDRLDGCIVRAHLACQASILTLRPYPRDEQLPRSRACDLLRGNRRCCRARAR